MLGVLFALSVIVAKVGSFIVSEETVAILFHEQENLDGMNAHLRAQNGYVLTRITKTNVQLLAGLGLVILQDWRRSLELWKKQIWDSEKLVTNVVMDGAGGIMHKACFPDAEKNVKRTALQEEEG